MKALLDLLVTSETKKQLLRLLWQEGIEASAHQLASLSGCSYASVYVELEQLVEEGLVLKTKMGRANQYCRNLEAKSAKLLRKLLGDVRSQFELSKLDDQEIEAQLFSVGVPIGSSGITKKKLSIEEVLVSGVILARKNSTVARAWPVGLAKNNKGVNFDRLLFLAQREDVIQEMGFFLELTSKLSGVRKLKKQALRFQDKRITRSRAFFINSIKGKHAKKLEERNTPRIAKKWHFSINMRIDSFSDIFNKTMTIGL